MTVIQIVFVLRVPVAAVWFVAVLNSLLVAVALMLIAVAAAVRVLVVKVVLLPS
jgi:hypothetical protein